MHSPRTRGSLRAALGIAMELVFVMAVCVGCALVRLRTAAWNGAHITPGAGRLAMQIASSAFFRSAGETESTTKAIRAKESFETHQWLSRNLYICLQGVQRTSNVVKQKAFVVDKDVVIVNRNSYNVRTRLSCGLSYQAPNRMGTTSGKRANKLGQITEKGLKDMLASGMELEVRAVQAGDIYFFEVDMSGKTLRLLGARGSYRTFSTLDAVANLVAKLRIDRFTTKVTPL